MQPENLNSEQAGVNLSIRDNYSEVIYMAYKKPIKKSDKIVIGGLYPQGKHGDLEVIGYEGCYSVTVRFVNTGYTRVASTQNILNQDVKDVFSPTVHGVGFFGVGNYVAFNTKAKRSTKQYKAWIGMLERCYSDKLHARCPTYIGCSVCHEWHNFQAFAEWFDKHYIEGFHLDKDIKIEGNKVYSPETCIFVSHKDNSTKAQAKTTKMTAPSGEVVDIYNMTAFCKKHVLNRDLMRNVATGKARQHKGWTKA